MRVLCVLGRHNYGDPRRGEGYEYSNFLPALRRLGHDVSVFESFSRAPYQDFAQLNRALLQAVESFQPDVVLCVLMQYEVWIESLRLIRQAGCRLVNWSTDDSWKYERFSRLIAREFDLYVTTYPDALPWYETDGIKGVTLSQWACNAAALSEPLGFNDCKIAVSFVGSAYGNRQASIARLRQAGIEVECFGYGWPAGPIPAEQIARIVRSSRVCLNFSEGSSGMGSSKHQIKARVFEVVGYGGCLLTEQAPHLERYFRLDHEIAVFRSQDEMIDKTRFLLSHPDERDKLSRRGYDRVRGEHTYDARFSALFERLGVCATLAAPMRIDWKTFDQVSRKHLTSKTVRALGELWSMPFKAVWGKVRGARAARRAAFELSWRLQGAGTYSASGLPGRLFYHES